MDTALRETTIDGVVAEQASIRAATVAVDCAGARLTYGELHAAACGFAAWMTERGVRVGDHVALWMPNGISWAIAHVAAARAGAVSVPVSTRLTVGEAAFIIEHSQAKVVVAADRFLGRTYADEARALVAEAESAPGADVVAVNPHD